MRFCETLDMSFRLLADLMFVNDKCCLKYCEIVCQNPRAFLVIILIKTV